MKFPAQFLASNLSKVYLLFLVSIANCQMLNIISIKQSFEAEKEISFAKLGGGSRNLLLPNNFIFCLSHLESSLDGNNFFTILGEDGSPWIGLSIWALSGTPILWVMQGSTWLRINELKDLRPISWINTCIQV